VAIFASEHRIKSPPWLFYRVAGNPPYEATTAAETVG